MGVIARAMRKSTRTEEQRKAKFEKIKEAMLLKKEQDKRKRTEEKVSEDERIFWSVVKYWNKQLNLRKHKINGNLSKTLRTAKKLIFDALKGKLNIDHEMCIQGKKYRLRHFKDGITKLNTAASDPAVGMKTNRWARQQSLSSFILNPAPIECSDPDGEFAFRNMSPFMFFIDNDIAEQERKKLSKPKDTNKTAVDDVYEQMNFSYGMYCGGEIPDTEKNWKLAERMTEYFIKFIEENNFGLDNDMKKPHQLAAEYFGLYFDKPNPPSLVWIDSPRTKERFFEFMLESNFLTDDRNGEIFDGGKFWFQLEQWQRDEILKQEAAERKKKEEVNKVIRERIKREAEDRKAEEVFVQPTNRFGNRDKKALYDERDMLKKKALVLGKGKEFNLLWHGWVVEYKSDPLKFHLFKDQVKELLGE